MRMRAAGAASRSLTLALALAACAGEASPRLGPGPAPTATVVPVRLAEVQSVIRSRLSALQGFRAQIVLTRSGVADARLDVEWSASGIVKESELYLGERTFYFNGREGRRVVYSAPVPPEGHEGQGRPSARVEVGIAAGEPLPPPTFYPVRPDLVALAREVLDLDEARVSRDTVGGRDAWVVQHSSPGREPDLQIVTIDDRTGLALAVEGIHAGQPQYQLRVETLTTDLGGDPSFVVPQGVPVSTRDLGFVRGSLEEARRAVSFVPILPASLPAGFTRHELTFTRANAGPAGPPDVVMAAYRRGMDLLVVTVGPRRGTGTNPFNPPASNTVPGPPGEGPRRDPPRYEPVTLAAGAFAGQQAQLSVDFPLGRSHLVAGAGESVAVTVLGDITPEEIKHLAESLQPVA